MLHPFADEEVEEAPARQDQSGDATAEQFSDFGAFGPEDGQAPEIRDYSIFKQPVEMVLRPHYASANEIIQLLMKDRLAPQMKESVEKHRERLGAHLEAIKKSFQIYVATAASESLYKEAGRLERRYFREGANSNQINFIKIKRYYEKIKTFNSVARENWRELAKVIDTLLILNETRKLAQELDRQHMRKLNVLMRRTDHFLDELQIYLEISAEQSDRMTGTIKCQMEYNEDIDYRLEALFGLVDEVDTNFGAGAESEQEKEPDSLDPDDEQNSLALNIILETRTHKLNRSKYIAVPILGSRDWNRTPEYRFEVPLGLFEECVDQFKRSYHVNMDSGNLKAPVAAATIGVASTVGEAALVPYKDLIFRHCNAIGEKVLDDDFPGLAHPEIFLYHCGARTIYNILLKVLRRSGLGEMLYVDEYSTAKRELPEELIQKLLIDWWLEFFANISGEDVDSYLSFSRQLEMVKREYRILYEEGIHTIRSERPEFNYLRVERWIRENRDRVFGLRKVEIFRRFISNEILK